MTGPWWAGQPPVEVGIACEGQEHRLSWSEGRLIAHDHPDPARERILIGLGARPAACFRVVDLWDAHSDDLALLIVASRGRADPVSVPADQSGRHDVLELLELPGRLPDLLIASVIATWSQRIADSDTRVPSVHSRLRAALYGRLVATIHAWRGRTEPIELEMIAPGTPASVVRDGDALQVQLEFAWLRDVWCRGLAVVGGRLCLSSELTTRGRWRLTTVDPDLGVPDEMTITLS